MRYCTAEERHALTRKAQDLDSALNAIADTPPGGNLGV